MSAEPEAFQFGRNWEDFVSRSFDEGRARTARKHLLGFLAGRDLRGKSFLDVGCGSGLSSLAAHDAGAVRIVSFDRDPDSVRATERVRALRGDPPHWTVLRGSILDASFVGSLERADVVYAWGVLHHTGKMWEAVERTAALMLPRGALYLALYTRTPRSDYWKRLKRRYNRAPAVWKRLMEARYVVRYTLLPELLRGRNPISFVRNYRTRRGMSYLTDLRDWLGGWPYEDAAVEEVLSFCRERLGLELVNIATGAANTEYLFVRRADG